MVLCDVISAVAEFMDRVLHTQGLLVGLMVLCDVISAVAEFMVRVLHTRGLLVGFMVLCDVISAVAEFMARCRTREKRLGFMLVVRGEDLTPAHLWSACMDSTANPELCHPSIPAWKTTMATDNILTMNSAANPEPRRPNTDRQR
jgi:hypothetical protein